MVSRGMESELDDLYREIILDHYKRPRNRQLLAAPDVTAEGVNPLCGDKVRLQLRFEDGRIAEVGFRGSGCAISQSSASLMTESVKQRTPAEAEDLRRAFEAMMTAGAEPAPELGDLESLQGVAKFHARVKCALLAWKVLDQALTQGEGTVAAVTTESRNDER